MCVPEMRFELTRSCVVGGVERGLMAQESLEGLGFQKDELVSSSGGASLQTEDKSMDKIRKAQKGYVAGLEVKPVPKQ